MSVFVLGSDGKPIMPCSEKRARLLLERNRARVVKVFPFTIQLRDRNQDNCVLQDIEIKIDPGSKYTGICISRTVGTTVNILNLFEIEHRGKQISRCLKERAALRRNRRNRKTRYRQPRFLNRRKPIGWLPPSLQHRVDTTISWIHRFQRYLPVTGLAVERVKFDMQKLNNPEISGIEYQQGTLFQYEIKEYLLEKWGRKCVYCNMEHTPLEIEHIIPKARGGTNRVSNLTISCKACNQAKGILPIEVFLCNKPDLLNKIRNQLKKPLKDATAVNATRNKLFTELLRTGLPVVTGTGGQTKYNRLRLIVPKTHSHDAACVGEVNKVNDWGVPHIGIKCNGRGLYSRTQTDKYGFPRAYLPRIKKAFGFATGDMIKTTIRTSEGFKNIISRIVIKTTGWFNLMYCKRIHTVKWSNCKMVQRSNGYSYSRKQYSFLEFRNKFLTIGRL
jgi:5-methylcytosine-specific restriction endonuclease McrA